MADYDETTLSHIYAAIRHYHRTGDPEKSFKLRDKLVADEFIPPSDYAIVVGGISPEVQVDDMETLAEPPRDGKGASKKLWVDFAKATSTMDPKVIEAMTRAELIDTLIERGIIPEASNDA